MYKIKLIDDFLNSQPLSCSFARRGLHPRLTDARNFYNQKTYHEKCFVHFQFRQRKK